MLHDPKRHRAPRSRRSRLFALLTALVAVVGVTFVPTGTSSAKPTIAEVKKQVDGKDVVQFERLLGELTSALDTRFVKVPRDGLASRFLPVKDGPELEARKPEILNIARDRGVVA